MKKLTLRKQLLIAESELNRAQLVEDWQDLARDAQMLADRAGTVHSLATAAISLLAGLASLQRKKAEAAAPAKKSWWPTVLKGFQAASSLWQQFRRTDRDEPGS